MQFSMLTNQREYKMKTTIELFNENFDNISTSLMDYSGFTKALTEHDNEIKQMIDEMIEEDTVNGYTTEIAIKLNELKRKAFK